MLTPTLRSKIDSLWDKFWSGGIANPLTAMEQISYLLFMRRLDAVDRKRQEDAEWLGQPYTSLFVGTYTGVDRQEHPKGELRWSHFRHLEGIESLVAQGDAIHQEQDALGPRRPDEHVEQGDRRARFAGAGRHHQQERGGDATGLHFSSNPPQPESAACITRYGIGFT
jgi:hypothetical protein